MNLLEKAIAVVSPKTAAQRARYRMAVQHFDGASTTYRQKGWRSPGGDANAVTRGAIHMLRRRSRDMIRNNAIARRAVDAIVDNVVGDGIVPSIVSDDQGLKEEIEALLVQHLDTTAIDAEGRQNLYGLQRLAMKSIFESGEILWLNRARRPRDGLPLNFQIETLESEFLDDRFEGLLPNGNNEFDGIQFDLIGRRIAYRLFEEHPEGYHAINTVTSRQIRADRIIHCYRMDRPKQRRGVPWLAPVMSLVADAYDYADAQLLRQKIAAMFVAFTRDVQGVGLDINDAGGQDADRVEELVPGMFEHLPPGRDVQFADPPKADGYGDHMSSLMHMIAAALGLTYEGLTMDMSEANFTQGRMGRNEMNRAMSAHQWTMLIPQICQPMEAWLRPVIADAVGDGRDYRFEWTPPSFPMLDPSREVPPALAAIAGGLTSRQRVVRERGFDVADIDRERQEDADREEELGLTQEEASDEAGTD